MSKQSFEQHFFKVTGLTNNTYSVKPGAHYVGESNELHLIQDKSVFDKQGPLHRARHDASLTYFQRCSVMYRAILGIHYPELHITPTDVQTKPAPQDASLLSDFNMDEWDIWQVPGGLEMDRYEFILYEPTYPILNKHPNKDSSVKENTIYLYKEGNTHKYKINDYIQDIPDDIRNNAINCMKFIVTSYNNSNEAKLPVKKIIFLQQDEKEVSYSFLDKAGKKQFIVYQKEALKQVVKENTGREWAIETNLKFSISGSMWFAPPATPPLELSLIKMSESFAPIGDAFGQLADSLGGATEPRRSLVLEATTEALKYLSKLPDPSYKRILLYNLFKEGFIDLERKQIASLNGQLGLLDFLIFPLLSRKLSYSIYDLLYRKSESSEASAAFVLKCIAKLPGICDSLVILSVALELLRKTLAVVLTVLCALTVVPVFHFCADIQDYNSTLTDEPVLDEQESVTASGITPL